ncbi:Acyl-CoA synthetase (AMP-forming)/AMP-acid ligase II [Actinacidiphila yanglinensis]|uniref:Acyl-CoA synthetase (AMP-forming)/AMP-acid ligase II n=1 Tax=Actinacidiphila yanglinensis TaxID=310779 RepID=A0A1H6D6E9_9ACTN|nr:non-ribosomal peptide synthetase [Actinacidiphila yanglinensis]SEG80949.1 Acyl-CoA synthetase (AMP-forming)/AMP-acid ligase II [Actinacidiphila yanglinensis]
MDAFTPAYGLLDARAASEPDRCALEVEGGGSLTFARWRDGARRVAGALLARGVRPGDRVALAFGEDRWDGFAVAYVGVLAAGGVAVPLPGGMSAGTTARALEHCGAVGAVHGGQPPPAPWTAALDDLVEGGPVADPVPVAPGDPAQILFTSGTTGTPKAVLACHANLGHGWAARPRHRPLAHSRHFLHSFPLGTNAAQTMLFNALGAAPTAVMVPRFRPDAFLGAVARYAAGTVFLVPAMAAALAARATEAPEACMPAAPGVLLVGCTGAALPPPVADALTTLFPRAAVVNYYTSTEAAPAQTTMVYDPARPSSVGRPSAGRIEVRDAAGRALPPGEAGDVWLASPTATRTYLGAAGEGAPVFRDGWTRMGDVGRLDADGYLHLLDRETDMVQVGGFKVATIGVEAALFAHPDVTDAAVVGVPDPVLGTVVAAAVVALPGARLDTGELRAFVRARLTEAEVPARVVVVEALPRNDGGKVVKRDLVGLFDTPVAPRVTNARTLAAVWEQVLAVREIAADANFFALGGDSFRAAQLAAAVAEEFGVEVPTTFAFDVPELAGQAARLDEIRGGGSAR